MSVELILTPAPVVYPDSDGKPMADNTRQFQWIQVFAGNLAAMYRDEPNVFVGGDLLWYYIKGDPETRIAPDAFVVFGRPKGHRGSYIQWEENDIPMTVVFEIRSPSNTDDEMREKHLIYEELGVEEYYVYDPDKNKLTAHRRGKAAFVQMPFRKELVSPRLGIRFEKAVPELKVYYPDGRPFLTFDELDRERAQAEQRAVNEAKRADTAEKQCKVEAKRADSEAKRADNEAKRADDEAKRAKRLSELSLKLLLGQITPEAKRELERLAQQRT